MNDMYLLRKLVLTFVLGVLFGGFYRPLAAEAPNIVWILGEDICPDLGCYGAKAVKTPPLDRLAGERELGLRGRGLVRVVDLQPVGRTGGRAEEVSRP
ncbi:MAG: hypothetical protein MK138_12485, partial [Planctomycetes bacterium]|nr:hypothetical protein [Planctomycetota bacterium]